MARREILYPAEAFERIHHEEAAQREGKLHPEGEGQGFGDGKPAIGENVRKPAPKTQCRAALALSPLTDGNLAEAHGTLGNALAKLGDGPGAVEEFRLSLKSQPSAAGMRSNTL